MLLGRQPNREADKKITISRPSASVQFLLAHPRRKLLGQLRVVQLDEVHKRNSIINRGLFQPFLESRFFLSIGCPDR
jgi:hypothetical protein